MKFKSLLSIIGMIAVWGMLTSTLRNPNNPPLGNTAAPGETTCQKSGCHANVGNFTGTVSISGVPDTVLPNQTYTITLTQASNAIRGGFQLTCLDASNVKCGTLTAGTGTSIGTLTGRQYIRQSTPKVLSGGVASWTFTWKAPATLVADSLRFYFVSLAANGDGTNSGDKVLIGQKKAIFGATSASHEPDEATLVQLYPNPAVRFVQIKLPTASMGALSLYNAAGTLVLERALNGDNKVDISALSSGIYLAKILVEGRLVTRQLVVGTF